MDGARAADGGRGERGETRHESELHADIYANHVYLADFAREWSRHVAAEAEEDANLRDADYLRGYARALQDVTAHLEAGDALPGGPLYERITARVAGTTPIHHH